MYCNHAQVGRTKVNKVREGIKTRKTHVQNKRTERTVLDKLFLLQNELFKDGLTQTDYKNHVQEKVNNDKYYYKKISEEDVSKLNERYALLIKNENNKVNKRGDEVDFSRNKKKKFREKKNTLQMEKKRELINKLFKEIKKSNSNGVSRNPELLSDDPDKWDTTKLLLFTGGRYLEGSDREWCDIYSKVESPNKANMFNLSSYSDLKEYVLEN
jgi:hypothetical protein